MATRIDTVSSALCCVPALEQTIGQTDYCILKIRRSRRSYTYQGVLVFTPCVAATSVITAVIPLNGKLCKLCAPWRPDNSVCVSRRAFCPKHSLSDYRHWVRHITPTLCGVYSPTSAPIVTLYAAATSVVTSDVGIPESIVSSIETCRMVES